MKTLHANRLAWAAGLIGLSLAAGTAWAQDAGAPPELSYGVPQIIQLSQAEVSDSLIVTYIRGSGNSYGLDANQIVYMRQQGVSEAVINAMLGQPKPAALAPTAVAAGGPAPVPTATVVYAPTATVADPASTVSVYVIPDTATYSYYARNHYYAGSYYAPVTIGPGFGGRWGGVYRNGWRH
jgi:hypothetical protein